MESITTPQTTVTIMGGSIFNSKLYALAVPVTCSGNISYPITAKFMAKYPELHRDYLTKISKGFISEGRPYVFKTRVALKPPTFDTTVVIPIKDHTISEDNLSALEKGLERLASNCKEWGIIGIAIPLIFPINIFPIKDFQLLLLDILASCHIPVEIYRGHDK